jgi:hypothetical protein
MTQRSVNIKTNVRGLDVLATVYAFAMALGLTQVFIGSQSFLTRVLSGTAPLTDEKTLLVLMLFANVALLGLRFFWAPRNLQSLVIMAARTDAIAPNADRARGDLSNRAIAFHLLIIFAHGTLFYLICAEFEFIAFSISSSLPLNSSVFVGYIIMHASLLLMNAAWIALVRRQEVRLASRSIANAHDKPSAGNVWWRNNLTASLFALAPFAIASTCQSETAQCIRQPVESALDVTAMLPTSPQVFASVYYDIVGLLSRIGVDSLFLPIYWVFAVFLINSAYDLLNAGRYYVFFEDVEWQDVLQSKTGPLDH